MTALSTPGMTLRQAYAMAALANPSICTGVAPEWQLRDWFENRRGIKPSEIIAWQAFYAADAMIAAEKADG